MLRDGASAEGAGPPRTLLQWLSQRYVSKVESQASLAALELHLLQNISLELQQHPVKDAVRGDILPSIGASVTQEVSWGLFRGPHVVFGCLPICPLDKVSVLQLSLTFAAGIPQCISNPADSEQWLQAQLPFFFT